MTGSMAQPAMLAAPAPGAVASPGSANIRMNAVAHDWYRNRREEGTIALADFVAYGWRSLDHGIAPQGAEK